MELFEKTLVKGKRDEKEPATSSLYTIYPFQGATAVGMEEWLSPPCATAFLFHGLHAPGYHVDFYLSNILSGALSGVNSGILSTVPWVTLFGMYRTLLLTLELAP